MLWLLSSAASGLHLLLLMWLKFSLGLLRLRYLLLLSWLLLLVLLVLWLLLSWLLL
ncbi:hypothetical protein AArcMg_0630 [Natrarchaeobaculum sulfurireducens]|nr:hypothetical protein AArcMg_0630 [Natrarchaeobaculum sulfurireducens]